MIGSSLGSSSGDPKPSTLDYTTKLLLPALSLVALILAQLSGKPPKLVWALAGLTVLFVLIGFSPSLGRTGRTWIAQVNDSRATKRAFPRFRVLVHSFGRFVDTRWNDTLHYILQSELCQGRGDQFQKLGIPDLQLWYSLSQHFIARVERQRPSVFEFTSTLAEFYHLVGAYNNYCVAPIFERLPRDFQEALTPAVRRSLNGFQQRFVLFLQELQAFLTQLAESRPAFNVLPRFFSLPKPL
jgi:hypothetical protein